MEAENEDLKKNLGRLQLMANGEVYDKQKYMEGAVWMGKRMSSEVERVCKVFETLMEDYKNRFSELEKVFSAGFEKRPSKKSIFIEEDENFKGDKKQRELELLSLQRAQVWFLQAI